MNLDRRKTIQRLLAAAKYYDGAIDGIFGPKSLGGINNILARRGGEATTNPARWSGDRRAIGAAQLILKYAGHSPGAIDGYWGNATEGAYLEWEHFVTYGKKLVLDVTPTGAQKKASPFPTQAQCTAFYGAPGVGGAAERQLIMVDLPYAMRIDWNLGQKSVRVRLHQKCADSALKAMREILGHYGEDRLRKLGLDRNAGTYEPRRMRGGANWSMHAYGCAWDFYAAPNGLTTRCPQALFCGEEYKAFFDIWEANGWTSLGRAIGRDWMHVQAASL